MQLLHDLLQITGCDFSVADFCTNELFLFHCKQFTMLDSRRLVVALDILTLKVLVSTIDALGHFETG